MIMSDNETDSWCFPLFAFLILITVPFVAGDSLETDTNVLMDLRLFLEKNNPVNREHYIKWNRSSSPCGWPGIICSPDKARRVNGINLSGWNISGAIFNNFSALTQLYYIDLSRNTFYGAIPDDLSRCHGLKYLNLSHNILDGELKLSGLTSLEILDLSINRISGEILFSFPALCGNLVVANLSLNNLTGRTDTCFDGCRNLRYLDLSSNKFSGSIWPGLPQLVEFSVSENNLSGVFPSSIFKENCSIEIFDLSVNGFTGDFPGEISNCRNLVILNLSGNNFTGPIPAELGSISSLEALFLGSNNFSRVIPESLLNLSRLDVLDLSNNNFGEEVQEILGRFTQVKFLLLHGNFYTGGLYSSGILKLPNLSRLDLSYNKFSGPLPLEIFQMQSLKFLILAYNQFNGSIPSEYGNMPNLQALDLSFNELTGSIPPSIGNLTSLLWLNLANNSLSGKIPREIGNCTSLLWVKLSNNKLSGNIPPELMTIGRHARSTFEANQRNNQRIITGSDECLVMRRWIPADYEPFSFVYKILTRNRCRSLWDKLLKGSGIFPVCIPGSTLRIFQITGYLLLDGNQLSGEVPPDIGKLQNFSMVHLGLNQLYGKLPGQFDQLTLVVLNLTRNNFSGEIPSEIGNIECLRNLDLSYNNFSGSFPANFNNLTELSKFNISYNPFVSGVIPSTGQLSTFEKTSYLGNPLLKLPDFIEYGPHHGTNNPNPNPNERTRKTKLGVPFAFLALLMAILICGVFSIIVYMLARNQAEQPRPLLEGMKYRHDFASSSGGSSSSPWLSDTVKVIRLDKTAFTHSDILKATERFSDSRIIGKGGFGIVYRGHLPDGREVAVKKLQREGLEGEREFRAEMEVLSGNGFGWPHPNLVTLYGWCLDGSEKILVFEYMEGGSLEDLISDRTKLTWRRRLDVAIDVARALVFLHHECYPPIVHRDVKASNVLLDKNGKARVTDFGLARVVGAGDSHVSTTVAGTIGYVAPEYGQTWHATTKGDVYSYGVLAMELATGRRALEGGEECLVEWGRRVMGISGRYYEMGGRAVVIPVVLLGSGLAEGAEEMCELLRIGVRCTAEAPNARPNMKEVLAMLIKILPHFD